MSERTSQLPHIELSENPRLISLQTAEAMSSGVIYGTASMVDGMIARYQEELGMSSIIATGGLATQIVPHCQKKITVDGELVLKGLYQIYQKNR